MTVNPTDAHLPPLSRSVRLRRRVTRRALEIFEGWSYQEIELPLLDYFDPLRDVIQPGQASRMYRLVDRAGDLRVLRGDVTPAIARLYAQQLVDQPLPLRVCYANKIVRIQRSFTRSQSESYQLGVEAIGAEGLGGELEVMLVCLETLGRLGLERSQVRLGNVAIFRRLIERAGLSQAARAAVTQAVHDRDPFALRDAMRDARGPVGALVGLEALVALRGGDAQLERVQSALSDDATLRAACDHMRALCASLRELGLGDRVHVDLGNIQGPDYYTGALFRIIDPVRKRILGGGGRYDDLIGSFGAPAPAVGFALGLDRLIDALAPGAADESAPPLAADAEVRVQGDAPTGGLAEALERRRQGRSVRLVTSTRRDRG